MVCSQLDQTITLHSAEVRAVSAAANADGQSAPYVQHIAILFSSSLPLREIIGKKPRRLLKACFQVRTWDVAR